MGRVSTEVVMKELRKMKREMSRQYKIDKMLLFGSRARGEELLTSDVDMIVVSKDFENIAFRKRPDKFIDAWKLPVDLEVLCYSPKEVKERQKEIGIVREAFKHGKEI